MSNTYGKIETIDEHIYPNHINNMRLTLVAIMGGDKHTQLTVITNSTLEGQSGVGYITLGDKEVDLLIAMLLERKLKIISATGEEQSIFSPNDNE